MSDREVVIALDDMSKYYRLYNEPKDRLKEALHPFKKKYYRPFYALKNIDLKIRQGDILGVVGRNGCGKSTLLKLITGVLQPSSGTVKVNGKITALLELGAGFNPEFSGLENIEFYAKILGISDADLSSKLDKIIEFAELGEFLDQPVKTYSSGMKSRLGFSVAVHVDPEILILDEVLAVGDELFKRKCYAKMQEFFAAGKTIIYVSHDAGSVNQLCNRAILIHQGEIILDGEAKEVTKNYERLLFAKPESCGEIVDSLKLKSEGVDKEGVSHVVPQTRQLSSYYIDGLNPKSTIMYKDYDVSIEEPKFNTLDGEVVNCLVHKNHYQFSAKVRFGTSKEHVAFGFVIKDLRGQIVSSLESRKQYDYGEYLDVVDEGSVVEVVVTFPCLFANGDYYIDFGVSGFKGDQIVWARGVDLCMFRVINNRSYSVGFVDILSSMNVRRGEQVLLNVDRHIEVVEIGK